MSRNYYSEINLHIVWHTKQSRPLLSLEIETATHAFLRKRLVDSEGVFVHEIGGTENHVHICVTVLPTVLVSELIGQLKGASAHEMNQNQPTRDKVLQWQSGYGVVSFGTKDLPWVREYVRNQKQHHASGSVHERLERMTQD
ncbi:IS200/IS605 family transposase [Symmachiella dynata]|uniref:IS200/IS605 family transposase n=1 Tax=Symmachiella dynata TaxID=2527995 RepID=UPI0030EBF3C4